MFIPDEYELIKPFNSRVSLVRDRRSQKLFVLKSAPTEQLNVLEKIMDTPPCYSERIYKIYKQESGLVYICDYCKGVTLRSLLSAKRRFSIKEIRCIMLSAAFAADRLNMNSVIHCDISPNNILVDISSKSVSTVLIDYGSARLADDTLPETEVTEVLGTEGYIAPERFVNVNPTTACDVFSLGKVLSALMDTNEHKNMHLIAKNLIRKATLFNPEKRIKMYPFLASLFLI